MNFLKPSSQQIFSSANLGVRFLHSSRILRNSNITINNKSYDLSAFKSVPQSNLYATIKIFNKPYLVTAGDKVILPHNLKNVDIGSVIKFNDIVNIGSRDVVFYPPTDDAEGVLEKVVKIEGTVIEKTKNKAAEKLTTWQRNRKNKRALVKHKKTVIRISEVSVQL
ncbi:mitochondrial 54S ribosomal protein YmL49 [Saccharomycopsis crataegensis]|uniref:Large ribosomal subunit protein bL21m n=1 Tax=Saccharomycopsis crataegensis TaxID=43959 RepID=A0AAV5QIN9_9ASCO|nr:mitochondrial 54S ribosomal protein YmL49 [Saccharomycopsis crataegensis]